MPSIRVLFEPLGAAVPSVRGLPRAIVDFYRDPASQLALLVTAVVMCYVGGIAMFWFHSVYLNEGGPAIGWVAHWLLDSSFAFVVLTPALALIMPLAAWAARALAFWRCSSCRGHATRGAAPSEGAPASTRLVPWLYAVVGGAMFALVTTPGPIAHDLVVGRGTWVAEQATAMVGDSSAPLAPVADYPPLAAMAQQFGAGLPLYVVLMALTVLLLRLLLRPGH